MAAAASTLAQRMGQVIAGSVRLASAQGVMSPCEDARRICGAGDAVKSGQ